LVLISLMDLSIIISVSVSIRDNDTIVGMRLGFTLGYYLSSGWIQGVDTGYRYRFWIVI
jgi:hypothetical protein